MKFKFRKPEESWRGPADNCTTCSTAAGFSTRPPGTRRRRVAASVVFARKPDGSWRICYDYRGLNAITEPLVEPLPHIDTLLDETRGACCQAAGSPNLISRRDTTRSACG